jgi:hypothetical protein
LIHSGGFHLRLSVHPLIPLASTCTQANRSSSHVHGTFDVEPKGIFESHSYCWKKIINTDRRIEKMRKKGRWYSSSEMLVFFAISPIHDLLDSELNFIILFSVVAIIILPLLLLLLNVLLISLVIITITV